MPFNRAQDMTNEDKERRTTLHWALSEGHAELVRVLLEHGADVNVQDKIGSTPFQMATSMRYVEVIRILLDRSVGNVSTSSIHGHQWKTNQKTGACHTYHLLRART
jgi:ankyrin repeat protein